MLHVSAITVITRLIFVAFGCNGLFTVQFILPKIMNIICCNSIPLSVLWCQCFGATCFLSIASGYVMEVLGVSKFMCLSTRFHGVTFCSLHNFWSGNFKFTNSGDFFFRNVPRVLQGAIYLHIFQHLHAEKNTNSRRLPQIMLDIRDSLHHDTIYENDQQDTTV